MVNYKNILALICAAFCVILFGMALSDDKEPLLSVTQRWELGIIGGLGTVLSVWYILKH